MDTNRTRIARLTRWSALIASGAFIAMACSPEEATPEPTEVPTEPPTTAPVSATLEPTPEPTEEPTPEPTEEPTPEPTEEPTPEPTEEPTPEPTEEPTPEPTEEPAPSEAPVASEAPAATVEPAASEEPAVVDEPAVSGFIVLPEGSTLEGAADWTLEIQDTSLADAPAEIMGQDAGLVMDEMATEIPFAANFDAAAIVDDHTYTLSAKVFDDDGNLMFTNDESVPVITNGVTDNVLIQTVLVAAFSPMASEEPMAVSGSAVTGDIVLPEGAVIPEGSTWSVELQDASKMDVPAETIAVDEGAVTDTMATEIPFVIEYDPESIDERFTYTLNARIEDADGNLLFINDTVTPGLVEGEPLEDIQVEVIDVQAQAAEAEAMLAEAEESPAA